jgi:beta-galactosidase
LSSWTWPGHEGRNLTLDVYSRHPRVSVYLDGVQLGDATTTEAEAFRARFTLSYRPGHLEVRAGGDVVVLPSAGRPAQLQFAGTDELNIIDDRNVYFVQVEIADAQGTWHPHADRSIAYSVEGGRILAIGSGDMTSTETYRANPRRSDQGRSLLVIEVDPDATRVTVHAKADGLEAAELRLTRTRDAPALDPL